MRSALLAMKTRPSVLLLGAGRSATALIWYLNQQAITHQWRISVADASADLLAHKLAHYPSLAPQVINLDDEVATRAAVAAHDLVISLMPPALHVRVAHLCLAARKHLITASYLSPEMMALHEEAKNAGLVFLNECGLDPGIDHLSAMEEYHKLLAAGHQVTHFASYCGGLVAPESNDNPWGYKITWNPMNVVLAGQGGISRFLQNGSLRFVPYFRLFGEATTVEVQGLGQFDAYPNRDSLPYRSIYQMESLETFVRGTLRNSGYCQAWQALVDLGLTDHSYDWPWKPGTTWAMVTSTMIPDATAASVHTMTAHWLRLALHSEVMQQLTWLGIFEDASVLPADHQGSTSPATMLLHLLLDKWKLQPHDKDMVVMKHQFGYRQAGTGTAMTRELDLVMIGQDQEMTAMAMGVGYPLGIAAKLILSGQVEERGVCMPVSKEWYGPMLAELEDLGIRFSMHEKPV